MAANNLLMPGYVYFDGTKYTTSQNLQGPAGPTGPTGATGPAGTITSGSYVLSSPLTLDGYVTIRNLHTQSGFLSDGYLTMRGASNVASGGSLLINSGGSFTAQLGSNFSVLSAAIQFNNPAGTFSVAAATDFNSSVIFNAPINMNESVGIAASKTLTIDGNLLVSSTGGTTFDSSVTVNSGKTLFVDGDIDSSGANNFTGSSDFVGATSFFGNASFLGPTNFRYYDSPGSNGAILIANSSVGGQFFTCNNSTGSTIFKTITDDGSVPKGTWFLFVNTSSTVGAGTNHIFIANPLGSSIITLEPKGETPVISDPITDTQLLNAINTPVWALIIKKDTANTSWDVLISGH